LGNIEFPARDEIRKVSFDRTDRQIALRSNLRDGFSALIEVEADPLRIDLGRPYRLCCDVFFRAVFPDNAEKIDAKALQLAFADAGYVLQRDAIHWQNPYQFLKRAGRQDFVKR